MANYTTMTVCEAISGRMNALLKERNMSLYRLSRISGVLLSTLQFIAQNKNKNVGMATVIQIAAGFDMKVHEFLNDPVFDDTNFDFK